MTLSSEKNNSAEVHQNYFTFIKSKLTSSSKGWLHTGMASRTVCDDPGVVYHHTILK